MKAAMQSKAFGLLGAGLIFGSFVHEAVYAKVHSLRDLLPLDQDMLQL